MAEALLVRKNGSSGNATASDLLSGKTATVITGDITGTMPNNGTVNITPSTTNQTIAQGYHSGSGVIYGDSDLVSSNIKNGVNIFGVTGTALIPSGTATASQVLTGYTFSNAASVGISGTMINQGSYTNSVSNAYGSGTLFVRIPNGAYLTNSGVGYPEITVSEPNLVAGNIKNGVSIFGVSGTYDPPLTLKESLTVSLIGSGSSPFSATVTGNTITASKIKAVILSVSAKSSYGITVTVEGSINGGSTWVSLGSASYGNTAEYGHAQNYAIITSSDMYNRFRVSVSNGSNWFKTTGTVHVFA